MFKRPAPPVPPKGDVVPVPVSVAFVCTHNACRSQIAEALTRSLAPGAVEADAERPEAKGPDGNRDGTATPERYTAVSEDGPAPFYRGAKSGEVPCPSMKNPSIPLWAPARWSI